MLLFHFLASFALSVFLSRAEAVASVSNVAASVQAAHYGAPDLRRRANTSGPTSPSRNTSPDAEDERVTIADLAQQKSKLHLKAAGLAFAEGVVATPAMAMASLAAAPVLAVSRTKEALKRKDFEQAGKQVALCAARPVLAVGGGALYSCVCLADGAVHLGSAAKALCKIPFSKNARGATSFYDKKAGCRRYCASLLMRAQMKYRQGQQEAREHREDWAEQLIGVDLPEKIRDARGKWHEQQEEWRRQRQVKPVLGIDFPQNG